MVFSSPLYALLNIFLLGLGFISDLPTILTYRAWPPDGLFGADQAASNIQSARVDTVIRRHLRCTVKLHLDAKLC